MARPRSDIQPRIVQAARERFVAKGVDGASLRGIARDAGTNIGMVYYYFRSKEELFLAVVEEVYQRLLEDVAAALSAEGTSRERIRRLYDRMAAMDETETKVVVLVIRESLVSTERLSRLVERFKRGHIALAMAGLAEGISAGDVRSDLHPALLVWGTMGLGLLPLLVGRVAPESLPFEDVPQGEEFAGQLVDLLFGGIGARPPSA